MKYIVHLIQTSNYEIEVEASDLEGARNAAWETWTKAPDVEGYAVGPIETEIAAATAKE
jgi:hypothetical protein